MIFTFAWGIEAHPMHAHSYRHGDSWRFASLTDAERFAHQFGGSLTAGIKTRCISPGPSKAWLKIKNPKAPAATRTIDDTF
jgi:hypothetical protein